MNEERRNMKEYGFISHWVERLFRFLQFLPPHRFIGNRPDYNTKISSEEKSGDKFDERVNKRSLKVEKFIISYFCIEIAAIFLIGFGILTGNTFSLLNSVFLTFCLLRFLNIVQVSVNMTLFDGMRTRALDVTASYVRNIVLIALNFIELIVIFGIVYYLLPFGRIVHDTQTCLWYDNFYFSVITQLTIGYGDFAPKGVHKIIVIIQGITAYFFTVLIIGRFISFLPVITEVKDRES
jgi:Ion channel